MESCKIYIPTQAILQEIKAKLKHSPCFQVEYVWWSICATETTDRVLYFDGDNSFFLTSSEVVQWHLDCLGSECYNISNGEQATAQIMRKTQGTIN